jgi:small subunit ribosomal protein S6
MRSYEAMFILQPDMDDEGINAFVAAATEVITTGEGELTKSGQLADRKGSVAEITEGWRTRRMMYPIKKRKEGYYIILEFDAPGAAVEALEASVRYNEDVLRHLVLRTDED